MKSFFANGCVFGILVLGALAACTEPSKQTLFSQLKSTDSGITFSNDLNDADSSSSFINEFGYMGGGVGMGDFNNDGLEDIFFCGNQVSSRLYINKGQNRFTDITSSAGVVTSAWCTGVSVVDINNDGYDDLYVCVYGKDLKHPSGNLLFINQHDLSFKEEAAAYGLADSANSTQAVFFDYDKDGDLDMFLVNYLLSNRNANQLYPQDRSGKSPASDKLYRNDGYNAGVSHPVYHLVNEQAKIIDDGYGLGVAVSDFNADGWPDLYVANDFLSNDELWLNNHDGSFTNCIANSLMHQSYSSMGCDAADVNNDGRPDIISLDMLPEINERKKTSFSFMSYSRYQSERQMGYQPEFMRNMLQLNNGSYLNNGVKTPFFSEIGQLAGIEATDWSWSALLADFNNDGWKDLHITNGIGRDFIDGDFITYSNEVFGSIESSEQQENRIREKLASLGYVNLPNYLYLNNSNYTFTDASDSSGIDTPALSAGAAYADLDNDGDLDLIVNNINREAFIFINNTIQSDATDSHHFLTVQLAGDSQNLRAFGAKLLLYNHDRVQMLEQNPVRGYLSSIDQRLFFGLGTADHIDSLVVLWPDGKRSVTQHVAVDTLLTLSRRDADSQQVAGSVTDDPLFSDIKNSYGISYLHRESNFNDYAEQPLLPHKYSQLGPFITTGDVNGDGLTDFFVGGAFNFSGRLFLQSKAQTFQSIKITDSIKMEEDMDCLFFDADGDGDQDLLLTSGDIQYDSNSVYYHPRLYLNDGRGNFTLNSDAIPAQVKTIAGCVSAADLDGDGDLDLFIGGRVSRTYPTSPRSFLLRNTNGKFIDVTEAVCPGLRYPGMLTTALWTDFNQDHQPDLIIAGEWMPIRFFMNSKGRLTEVTSSTGLLDNHGMWRKLVAADMDDDGDTDLVAGNLGLNAPYRVDAAHPMELFAADVDRNGKVDPIPFYFIKTAAGKRQLVPGISLDQLAAQVPNIKQQFPSYDAYAHARVEDFFTKKALDTIMQFRCQETRNCWFENTGNGKFVKHPLPMEAQFAPVNAILCDDFDSDGIKDLLLAGNDYQTEVSTGRFDASYGCFLHGNGKKSFLAVPSIHSGFLIRGDVRDLAIIPLPHGKRLVLAAVNNDSLRTFRVNTKWSLPDRE